METYFASRRKWINYIVFLFYNTYRGWTEIDCQDRHWNTDQKEDGTLDDWRRDGGTNSNLRTKEQGTHLTLNEQDDDDDDPSLHFSLANHFKIQRKFYMQILFKHAIYMATILFLPDFVIVTKQGSSYDSSVGTATRLPCRRSRNRRLMPCRRKRFVFPAQYSGRLWGQHNLLCKWRTVIFIGPKSAATCVWPLTTIYCQS